MAFTTGQPDDRWAVTSQPIATSNIKTYLTTGQESIVITDQRSSKLLRANEVILFVLVSEEIVAEVEIATSAAAISVAPSYLSAQKSSGFSSIVARAADIFGVFELKYLNGVPTLSAATE